MSKKIAVFIDDGYLKLISKHFNSPKYSINQFAITLAKEQGFWCEQVYFYTAPPHQSSFPSEDERNRKAKYDRFIAKLKQIPNFFVREGRCQKIDGEYRQKGVDTLLTMDLMQFPLNNDKINSLIIITSDTDFVPILNHLRSKHEIRVILYHYTDKIRDSKFSTSNHLYTACDTHVMIQPEHFEKSKFYVEKNDTSGTHLG